MLAQQQHVRLPQAYFLNPSYIRWHDQCIVWNLRSPIIRYVDFMLFLIFLLLLLGFLHQFNDICSNLAVSLLLEFFVLDQILILKLTKWPIQLYDSDVLVIYFRICLTAYMFMYIFKTKLGLIWVHGISLLRPSFEIFLCCF